jgi:hypothetical protein
LNQLPLALLNIPLQLTLLSLEAGIVYVSDRISLFDHLIFFHCDAFDCSFCCSLNNSQFSDGTHTSRSSYGDGVLDNTGERDSYANCPDYKQPT